MVAPIIVKNLIKITSYCFTSGIIPKSLKKFITVVLYKEGKKDYFFLSSYKLIAFKNILAKVLKKYIINIISKAIKELRLFL